MTRFRHVVVSGRIGMVKPEPRIYAHLLEHVREPAERCVFIDDNAINVDAAARFGLVARRVVGISGAREAFRELGLLEG